MDCGKINSIFSSPASRESLPFFILIMAPTVAKNGFPRMIEMWESSSISKKTKSHGIKN